MPDGSFSNFMMLHSCRSPVFTERSGLKELQHGIVISQNSKSPLRRSNKAAVGDLAQDRKEAHGSNIIFSGHVFIDLPIEILLEIFCHLDLAGVFFLSRTAKFFRNILMHKSSALVWKRAYTISKVTTHLPDCPDDLTELQFAHLAFEPICHFCWRRNCHSIMWVAHTRCCSKCRNENFTTHPTNLGMPYEGVPFDRIGISTNGEFYYQNLYSLSALERYNQEYLGVPAHEIGAWLAKKKDYQRTQVEFAQVCRAWSRRWDAAQAVKLRKARRKL